MKTMSATIDIDAPPQEVWAVLTDLGRYHEWNPLFVDAAGNVAVGQRIRLRSKHPANGRLMTVKPKITAAQPGAELRWAASLPGIISGEHSFTLTGTGSGTRLVQSESFKGLLTRFSRKTFANAGASFEALNEALKERAEARVGRPAGSESLGSWPMTVTVRPGRPGDGAGITRAWLSAGAYYSDLDPDHFQVPRAEGLAESWDRQFTRPDDGSLHLVADVDGQVVGWLWARILRPGANAAAQLTREHGWTRLEVASLIVDRDYWRSGAGTALLEAAEAWGRARGAEVVTLDTYVHSPVSVPFYEDHMGYQRRAIVFQKRL